MNKPEPLKGKIELIDVKGVGLYPYIKPRAVKSAVEWLREQIINNKNIDMISRASVNVIIDQAFEDVTK